MEMFVLLLVAAGLAADAFAVSLSNGISYHPFGTKEAVAASFSFGFFQMVMPVIGYFAGRSFSWYIQSVDHWIALVLLGAIGGKMALDGIRELKSPNDAPHESRPFSAKILILQSIATSIDALAIGIGFAVLQVHIFLAAGLIGVVTFVLCIIGSKIGLRFGALLGRYAQIAGGLLLVFIGLHIFMEHMHGF